MKKILVFGNPYIKEDNLAVRIAKKLNVKDYEVEHCTSPDDLLNYELENVIILDAAKGIDKVEVFDDIDSLEFSVIFSLHDFDLGFFLKVLKKAGKVKRVNIIGVPQGYDEESAFREVEEVINNMN